MFISCYFIDTINLELVLYSDLGYLFPFNVFCNSKGMNYISL